MDLEGTNPSYGDQQLPTVPHIVRTDQMLGEDKEETTLLREMLEEAKNYALSFSWCESVLESYFGGGIGKIIAVFLFRISPSPRGVGPWMWFIVGDIPPAYLPLEDCDSPKAVFATYLAGMNNWVRLARHGRTGAPAEGVPPVNVPATPEWAGKLESRIRLLSDLASSSFE